MTVLTGRGSNTILRSMNSSYGITSKFQITIPKKIRDELNLTDKDRFSFERRGDDIVLRKVKSFEEVSKMLQDDLKRRKWNKVVTQEDMDNARDTFYKKGLKWE